jgi:hypothetical protein
LERSREILIDWIRGGELAYWDTREGKRKLTGRHKDKLAVMGDQ